MLYIRMSFWLTIGGVLVLAGSVAYGVEFVPLGDLPGGFGIDFSSAAYGISGDGLIIVGSGTALTSPLSHDVKAAKWMGGPPPQMLGYISLSAPAFARDVSADGAVIVGHNDNAMMWTASGPTSLGTVSGFPSHLGVARGVSADGSVIAGYVFSAATSQAFHWTGGVMTGLTDLPGGTTLCEGYDISADGNIIVGVGWNASDKPEACYWVGTAGPTGLGCLSGGTSSFANGTNTDGSVIVGYSNSSSGTQAFRWTSSGGMEGLGQLPGGSFWTKAQATNADGGVVVGYGSVNYIDHAFVWDEASGMHKLADVLSAQGAAPPSGWTLSVAYDVSNDGRVIVGYGTNPDDNTEACKAVLNDLGAVLTTSSAAAISQTVSTPDNAFDLTFDYRFLTTTGTLTVELADNTLTSIAAPGTVSDTFTTETVPVGGPLPGLDNVTLAFTLEGPTGSSVVIDDIVFPELGNGGFLLGLNDWQSVGDVGTMVIPEPGTLMLSGTGLLGLLAYLHRRRTTSIPWRLGAGDPKPL